MSISEIKVDQLKLAYQEALIGEIYPDIKAIAFDYVDKNLTTRMYLSRSPKDEDYEAISSIVAEVISRFSHQNFKTVTEECLFTEAPINRRGESIITLVYAKKD